MSCLQRVVPVVAVSLGFAVAACSSSSGDDSSNGAPDAAADTSPGVDAATPDGSHDGAVDGAADSGADAAHDGSTPPAEAGPDGGSCTVPTTPVGTGTLTGTLNGAATMTVADVAIVMAQASPGSGPWGLTISFSDFAHACGYKENAALPQGSNIDSIIIQTTAAGATPPFTIGSYPQVSLAEEDAGSYTYDISLDVESFDGTCNDSASRGSVTGSVTLTNAGPTAVAGTYDLMTPTSHITGTFDAPLCTPAPATTTRLCCP
jgi:hypothetical protein